MLYLGRAPRTKETLPDFLKWRRITRHPLVFRGLTESQRTPGFGASQVEPVPVHHSSEQPVPIQVKAVPVQVVQAALF